jgi:cellulose synthase/poly-beta-1,6-N-acetylglucosamine synthase-like glycosyltransferase
MFCNRRIVLYCDLKIARRAPQCKKPPWRTIFTAEGWNEMNRHAKMLRCSVVIPVKNGAAVLGDCLRALSCQTIPASEIEVIVVDDGSTDDTVSVARCYEALVLSQPPSGAAAARNLGSSEAKAEIVLFIDADCDPMPDWIEQMLRPFEDPTVAGVKGAYYSRQTEPMARFVQHEYEDKYERMSRFRDIDFIDTYSAAFRRRILRETGGYDTVFPNASVEDQEFSFRVARAGHKMRFAPKARVMHLHVASIAGYARKKFKIGYWKIRVLRLHPQKMLADSHTPQALKLQIVLLGLAVPMLAAGCVFPSFRTALLPGLLAVAAFLLTTLPMIKKTASGDPPIAWRVPLYIAVRSLALGAGMIAGLLGSLDEKKHTMMSSNRSSKCATEANLKRGRVC